MSLVKHETSYSKLMGIVTETDVSMLVIITSILTDEEIIFKSVSIRQG